MGLSTTRVRLGTLSVLVAGIVGLAGGLTGCTSTGGDKTSQVPSSSNPSNPTAPPVDPRTALPAGIHDGRALPADAKWVKLNTVPYRGKQDDISFVDANTGWYGNGAGKLYKTTDGGTTWQEAWSQPGTFVRALGFLNAQNGLMGNIGTDYFPGVSDTHPLYRTADGGKTFSKVTQIAGPTVKGICSIDILPTQFVNSGVLQERTIVHAAGRVGGPAVLMRSLDGGATFTSQDLSAVAGMILDVKFFDASTGLLFAATDADVSRANALILHTVDGGTTWKQVYRSTRPFELTWKASFPTRNIGYATLQSYNPDKAVSQRYVLKTTDGGRSWQEVPLVNDHAVRQFGVAFATPSIGWVGATTSGFQTADGGQTWTKVQMGQAVNKIRIMHGAKNSVTAYAIGVDVYKLQTNLIDNPRLEN